VDPNNPNMAQIPGVSVSPAGSPMSQIPGQYNGPPGQPQLQVPLKPTNPNSTQNALLIAEVRDGIVIMSDGSFRSVLMLKSINFDLMSPQEREAVEFSYQGFLNSLYFPIQIMIRSQKVDLRPYIEKLDKIRTEHDNMLLALLMEDYIQFMSNIAQQTNIMDKRFYIVIPFIPAGLDAQKAVEASKNFISNLLGSFKNKEQQVTINEADLEAAKTELRNRVQACLSGLLQCGIQGLPLDTQELIELYYDAYNPDTATRQQLKNFNDLVAPVITKGQGEAPQPGLEKELM
jgi:type IV secretory pathway VirB4 component